MLKAFNVLAVVSGAEEPLTPTAITGRTFVGKTNVTSVLDAPETQWPAQPGPGAAAARGAAQNST